MISGCGDSNYPLCSELSDIPVVGDTQVNDVPVLSCALLRGNAFCRKTCGVCEPPYLQRR